MSDAPSLRESPMLEQADLPAPRLQLRWTPHDDPSRFGSAKDHEWDCHYELALPLREHDCRREIYDDDGNQIGERAELVVALKSRTIRGSSTEPCWDRFESRWYADAPFRDGCHAQWDASALGGLPIYVIAATGYAFALELPSNRKDGSSPQNTEVKP